MPATLLSIAEFELLPDLPGKQELLEGEVILLPPAKLPHSKTTKAFVALLMSVLDESRVFSEAGYQMAPDTWLQPDVSVTWPDQPVANDYLQGSPMIAIEIVSRGNTADEIERKIAKYLRYGAAEVWIVYPSTHRMMVHRDAAVERISDTYTCHSIPAVVRLSEILGTDGNA
jgi:Uma2 family endonuclease